MTEPSKIVPFAWKDRPALIESLLPVQKLSAESFKEQMAGSGKTLTSLGSYWKGRKPLILNKACILGCLLPVSENPLKDMQIFEMLMGMDHESIRKRLKLKTNQPTPSKPYRELIEKAKRPEELSNVHDHIWQEVNAYLGTNATSFPKLVEEIGILRFGHRPKFADTFCGSGQIPFEAARLGCDVTASDLNPIACMLTWGAFNIVGGSEDVRKTLGINLKKLVIKVKSEIDSLNVECDTKGWHAKAFLYCTETRCLETGWAVPLIPSLIISKGYRVIAELIPDNKNKRYEIYIRSGATDEDIQKAEKGTVLSDGKGKDPYLVHTVNGIEYRTKISSLRGDYKQEDKTNANKLRMWTKQDFKPRPDDIFQERLYCIQWMRQKVGGKNYDYEFRTITPADLDREKIVDEYVGKHLEEWQEKGWIPDMRIEPGYNTDQPIRERGWTHWHHLFNPRQLLLASIYRKYLDPRSLIAFTKFMDYNAKLCMWDSNPGVGRAGKTIHVFYNQALNTLFNYATRSSFWVSDFFEIKYKAFQLETEVRVFPQLAGKFDFLTDIFITDPPYGDAVHYEEILDYFIAWLRKKPPEEFKDWVWDSRRPLAIKGEDEKFRQDMVAAYKRMTECMPDNGIQVIMFTHQSEKIWADLATIVWASGLQVTAAWYVVTETDSALRQGSNVKGTVLLVCRKRTDQLSTFRDDLAYELKDEVKKQIEMLTGLNQQVTAETRDENPFGDADLQMAGYAAALRVLTKYTVIDGKNMPEEALRPRGEDESSMVAELIEFAVSRANRSLVPTGVTQDHWNELKSAERFYLKMLEMESKGAKTLDNYQNFAKAFGVGDFKSILASKKANQARLKSAVELGKTEMGDGSELADTSLRAVLYALWELQKDVDGDEVLTHLSHNLSDFYQQEKRAMVSALSEFLANTLIELRPEEASAARVLAELVRNQQM